MVEGQFIQKKKVSKTLSQKKKKSSLSWWCTGGIGRRTCPGQKQDPI
jgi:hypothetical protein